MESGARYWHVQVVVDRALTGPERSRLRIGTVVSTNVLVHPFGEQFSTLGEQPRGYVHAIVICVRTADAVARVCSLVQDVTSDGDAAAIEDVRATRLDVIDT